MSIIHPRYGFERSLFGESLGEGERFGVKKRLADHVFLKRMVPEIEKLPKPFFAFLITITSHHPYVELPAHHKVLETGHLENAVLSGYLHSMHYVDRCLEDLFRDLKEAGLLEETVVAIYGDHDARIRPKHDLYDFLGYEKNNFSYLAVRSWLDRVPLIIAVPGGTAKGEIREVGGHVDIAPTLLYLLGIRQPACFIGEALIPGGSNTAVLTSPCWGSAVTQDRMYIKKYKGYEDICVDPVSREIVPDEMCDVLKKQAEMTLDYSSLAVLHDLAREIAGFDTGEEKRPITE